MRARLSLPPPPLQTALAAHRGHIDPPRKLPQPALLDDALHRAHPSGVSPFQDVEAAPAGMVLIRRDVSPHLGLHGCLDAVHRMQEEAHKGIAGGSGCGELEVVLSREAKNKRRENTREDIGS